MPRGAIIPASPSTSGATEADEAHGFEPHYELHAWIVRENPNGTFAPFNPDVTCEHHTMPEAVGD